MKNFFATLFCAVASLISATVFPQTVNVTSNEVGKIAGGTYVITGVDFNVLSNKTYDLDSQDSLKSAVKDLASIFGAKTLQADMIVRVKTTNDNSIATVGETVIKSGTTLNWNWGDGVVETNLSAAPVSHTYATSGEKDIKIYGNIVSIQGQDASERSVKRGILKHGRVSRRDDSDIKNPWIKVENGAIENVKIPDSVKIIGKFAFYEQPIESVEIPSSVTQICCGAFSETKISSFTLPASVEDFGNCEFDYSTTFGLLDYGGMVLLANYSNLSSLSVEAGNSKYSDCGKNCIYDLEHKAIIEASNQTYDIPSDCETIYGWSFYGRKLNIDRIPRHVAYVGGSAFGATKCGSFTIDRNLDEEHHGWLLFASSSLTNVVFEGSVTNTGDSTFYACRYLNKIDLPSSITYIGSACFDACTSVTSITCRASTPPYTYADSFGDVNYPDDIIPSNTPVYVPSASIESYKAATGWTRFTNFLPLE